MTRVLIIINPISGPARRGTPESRIDRAQAGLTGLGVHGDIRVTERTGHAHEIALEAAAEIEVRRAVGQATVQPGLGELVYEGPVRPVIVDEHAPLTDDAYFYTVFTRRRHAGGAVYSGGVETQALEPTSHDLLPMVEAEAAQADADVLPPRIRLCFTAMDALGLAGGSL